ncbi:MAG TPA: HEAT repeat domain-containing protein [Longimicrobium sp.]|nr:HEAT repeat domain-containing protein [Longimicrobium sp.]
MLHRRTRRRTHTAPGLALAAALLLAPGCAMINPPPPRYGTHALTWQVRRMLNVEEPTPAFYRERARLEVMGPELDEILIGMIEDESLDEPARANAVLLLADRQAPYSVTILRRQLLSSPSDRVRAAAVTGLQRFVPDSAVARTALRAAVGDPSSLVRLNVLQHLDVEDAPLVRALLRREENGAVRTIARQLLTLLEGRGAPLEPDERGDLRTAGGDSVPHIVFHPTQSDREGRLDVGALWVEMPDAALVPLAQRVEVVNGVVPAFFDPNRRVVVFEEDRMIHMRDLASGQARQVGQGIAPRVMPFTKHFVFVREVPGSRREDVAGTLIDYEVLRASFEGGEPLVIGRTTAAANPNVHRGASPVRWMVVGEVRDAFVLRGPSMVDVALPGPFEPPPAPAPPSP